jgi:hypothetical protein
MHVVFFTVARCLHLTDAVGFDGLKVGCSKSMDASVIDPPVHQRQPLRQKGVLGAFIMFWVLLFACSFFLRLFADRRKGVADNAIGQVLRFLCELDINQLRLGD